MNKKTYIILPLIIAVSIVIGVFFGKFFILGQGEHKNAQFMIYPQNNKIQNLINLIDKYYVDTVSKKNLVESAIPTIINDLDPHTVYIPAKNLDEVNEQLAGDFGGIGVQFSIQNDTVMVIQVIGGSPSERVGLLAGDRIVHVNDSNIAGIGIENQDVMDLLRGEKGSEVDVTVYRPISKNKIDFTIIRSEIPLYSVDVAYEIKNNIGYIKVSRFAQNTYQEFLLAIAKLRNEGVNKLVVDLRGNQGGYLGLVVNMCNEFLDKGDLIVYTQGKAQPKTNYFADNNGSWKNNDIVVLIDEWSASASEIFAGAIQDNDRGLIVGRRSFGKGLVQEQFNLNDGSAIRLTVSRYYTPVGRCIQKPYEEGREEYRMDIMHRYVSGEPFDTDSTDFPDSLAYKTPAGRTVFGGGGIMPDVYVPRDTTALTDYYNSILQKGLIYQFAFQFTDEHRNELSGMRTAAEIDDYLSSVNLVNQFVRFATERGVKRNSAQLANSQNHIDTQIRAYIARNILDNEGFYPIIFRIDETLQKAVEILEQDKVAFFMK